jgi:formylaminopyrimidine deformylase / aminopyrimidine aminohydrolase
VPVAALLSRAGPAWRGATDHPFLHGVRDGSLPAGAFDTWLLQDALYVADLLRFQARLLARAPRPAQAVLAAGLVGLVAELDWFGEHAAARGLRPDAAPLPATRAYAALLDRLDAAAPAPALVALWALERVYLDAWSSAAPGSGPYAPFVEHWTTPDFAGYVADLERTADALLAGAGPDGQPGGDHDRGIAGLVAEVLAAESGFWEMALPTAPAR